jgi:serine protease
MPSPHIRLSLWLLAGLLTPSLLAWAQTQPHHAVKSSARAEQVVQRIEAAVRLNRLIVKFREEPETEKDKFQSLTSAHERIRGLNIRLTPRFGGNGPVSLAYLKSVSAHAHVVRTRSPMSHAALNALAQTVAQDPGIEYAEVDERVYPHFVPNDTFYAGQQAILKSPAQINGGVNLPNAWGRSVAGLPVNGAGVTVAVLDTGYRPHADLLANIVPGFDFVSPDGFADFFTSNDGDGRDDSPLDPGDWNTQAAECEVGDSSWHGTHAAGIIGAVGNNNAGVIGVAYRAKILPVRVLGRCGGYSSDTAAAVQWAAGLPVPGVPLNTHVAQVINMSFGRSGACSLTYQAAVTAARNAGSVIVASTGNDYSRNAITQPGNCAGVIAVTAHTATGANADYANIGFGTTISAPGDGIYTTSNTGTSQPAADNFDYGSGTSYAAPHVSGVAALLIQIKPGISPAEVQLHLTSSARAHPIASYCANRTTCGAGLLDAFRAVHVLQQAQGISNSAPLMDALPTQYVLPGASLQFAVSAQDPDGDEVSFTASGLPASATFDSVTGVFQWNRVPATPGEFAVVIQPTDGAILGASIAVKIAVTASIPLAPVFPIAPVTPTTGSSGGGGAPDWLDMLCALLLLLIMQFRTPLTVDKPRHINKARHQNGNQSA